jgi:hypothetical protein
VEHESCRICGGDGRITNSFGGSSATCPACHGTGRRGEEESLVRDVTKTKSAHFRKPGSPPPNAKPTWPTTGLGIQLANEVKASPVCSEATKERLIREIIEYEGTHGHCTQTFTRKVRKQLRP